LANEFYDLRVDHAQKVNLYNDPKYSETIKDLNTKLALFFDKYVDPKYDLWNGGSAKATLVREEIWKNMYGPKWHVIIENGATVPKFKEAGFRNNNEISTSSPTDNNTTSQKRVNSITIKITTRGTT
jgi:hypothetical protein